MYDELNEYSIPGIQDPSVSEIFDSFPQQPFQNVENWIPENAKEQKNEGF